MTDYQRAYAQIEKLNRAQLQELKHFTVLTYCLKKLTAQDLKNLIGAIDEKLNTPKNIPDIEVTD